MIEICVNYNDFFRLDYLFFLFCFLQKKYKTTAAIGKTINVIILKGSEKSNGVLSSGFCVPGGNWK
ncbi:hypothetical protein GCM10023163_08960 [Aestuariibaculum suncheonense]